MVSSSEGEVWTTDAGREKFNPKPVFTRIITSNFPAVNCYIGLPKYFAVWQPVPTKVTVCPNMRHGWGHHLIPHIQWRQHGKVTRTWGTSDRPVSKIRQLDSPHSSRRCAPTVVSRGGVPTLGLKGQATASAHQKYIHFLSLHCKKSVAFVTREIKTM